MSGSRGQRASGHARGRLWRWAGYGLLTCLGMACPITMVSYAPKVDLVFVDDRGRLLPGVWVAYRYRGSRFNLVDSLAYRRPGALAQSETDGRLRLPGFFHVHAPLDGGLQPVLEWVFSPGAHNFGRPWALEPRRVPDRYEIVAMPARIVLVDQSARPEGWLEALTELRSVLRYRLPSTHRSEPEPAYAVTEAQRQLLQQHFNRELTAFIAQHGETPRMPPVVLQRAELSPEEQAARDQQIARDLAAAPRFGDYARRLFRHEPVLE